MTGPAALSVLAAARDAPERIAVIDDDAVWRYAELARTAGEHVHLLRDAARRSGAPALRVAHTCASEPLTLSRLAASFELGWPAILLHDRWTAREREEALALAGPAVDPRGEPRDLALTPPRAARLPAGTLVIAFTSGTGGGPKAVLLDGNALVASARAAWAHLGRQADDRWLSCLPLAHVGGLSVFTRCLEARRAVVLLRRFDTAAVAEALEKHRVTIASLVPAMLERLFSERPRWTPPSCLRAVLLGGAPASPRLLREARRRAVPVLVTYGMTETASMVATQDIGAPPGPDEGCGRPLPGVEIRIENGVIEVRGDMVARDYLTADGTRPVAGPDGWFSTGDLGRLDDGGRLHVAGRRGAVIVTGGENVSAEEVEGQLRQCPGISRALVFAVPDDAFGERVAAALVPAPDGPPEDDVLAAHVRRTLAPYKWPRSIAYVERLPATTSGKVSRGRAEEELSGRLRPFRAGTGGVNRAPSG